MRKKHVAGETLLEFNVVGQQQCFHPLFLLFLLCVLPPGCVRPPGVQHGDLLNRTEANRGSFLPGSLLMYGCEPGYTADGPTSIICTSLGVWSHQPPRCIRNNSKRQRKPLTTRVQRRVLFSCCIFFLALWLFQICGASKHLVVSSVTKGCIKLLCWTLSSHLFPR